MKSECAVHWLGLVDYQQAWDLQNELASEIGAGRRRATLLLLEHPHTYTFGRRGDQANLLWSESELARRGITVHWVDRGGDVTYHGPGQLVGYPLLPLGTPQPAAAGNGSSRLPQADYVGYLRWLEETILLTLERLGIPAIRVDGLTGVWIPADGEARPAKIASIGVKVDARGISRHGFALNLNPQMDYWKGIIGCGLEGYPATSIAEQLGEAQQPSMESLCTEVVQAFGEVFGFRMTWEAGRAGSLKEKRGPDTASAHLPR